MELQAYCILLPFGSVHVVSSRVSLLSVGRLPVSVFFTFFTFDFSENTGVFYLSHSNQLLLFCSENCGI